MEDRGGLEWPIFSQPKMSKPSMSSPGTGNQRQFELQDTTITFFLCG